MAAPALRDRDHARFNLYKPLDKILLGRLEELNQTHINLEAPVSPSDRVNDAFPPVQRAAKSPDMSAISIIAIIHVDDDIQDTIRIVQRQHQHDGPLSLITIHLTKIGELAQPDFSRQYENSVVEVETSAELPAFVWKFDQDLLLPRFPDLGMTPPYTDFVKMFLGDDEYRRYFADPSDNSAARRAELLEFIHYNVILFDKHILDARAYRANNKAHVYSLLRPLASNSRLDSGVSFAFGTEWPLSLIINVKGDQYRYVPRSDFSIATRGFPVLLLDATSDQDKADGKDMYRILLQASCLVRVGNALLKDGSRTFLVKAIHIDSEYYATEYTLYQRPNSLNNHVHMVEYFSRSFNLRDERDTFKFFFRLYNFISSMEETCGKISRDFPFLSASLKNQAKQYPDVTPWDGRDGSSGKNNSAHSHSMGFGATMGFSATKAVVLDP